MSRRLAVILMLFVWGSCAVGAIAQTTTTQPVIYRLDDKSSFAEGCSGGICLCAIVPADRFLGTFKLTRVAIDPLFTVYEVSDVNWLASISILGQELRITGSGTYRVGGEFALVHQLDLDLKIGDQGVQHFSSGLVPGASKFPAINITIAQGDVNCQINPITVSATPVPPAEIARYRLMDSSYQEGCFGPCDCAVISRPVMGRFGLVKLSATDTEAFFGVVNVGWTVQPTDPAVSDSFPVSGSGIYHISSFLKEQRMVLDLSLAGKEPQRFDSGVVPGGGNLRRIDLPLPANGFACFDQVFDIHAFRFRPSASLPSYHPLE